MKSFVSGKPLSLFYRKDMTQFFGFERFLRAVNTWYCFVAVVITCIICYFFFDIKTALWMNAHINGQSFQVIEKITQIADGTWYYIGFFLLFCLCKLFNKNKLANICLFIFLSLVLSGMLCEAMKILFGRCRPDLYINNNLYGLKFFEFRAPMQSFPSGHTVNITALMIACSFIMPRYWLGFSSVFVLLGLSRIALDQHFLSDVIFGMFLSIVMVTFLYKKVSGTLIPKILKL